MGLWATHLKTLSPYVLIWTLRVFLNDARGCQCPFVLCLHPQGQPTRLLRPWDFPGKSTGVSACQSFPASGAFLMSRLFTSGGQSIGPLGGTQRVGGLLGVAGRLSGTVSPFRAEQGTSLETPSRARASSCQAVGTTPWILPWFSSLVPDSALVPFNLLNTAARVTLFSGSQVVLLF